MKPQRFGLFVAAAFVLIAAPESQADVFDMPHGQTSLTFVTVGNSFNAPDTTGLGAVGYTYQMGKYDVTAGQYVQFLNAVAKTDPYGLYNASMSGTAYSGIQQTGVSGSYVYTVDALRTNRPINFVSFGAAVRFCNWLTNGQPSTGSEDLTTTENGSYYLIGATDNASLLAVARQPGARYVLPTSNEWYKAAYYNGTTGSYWAYSTQSNVAPLAELPPGSGGPSGSANYKSVTGTSDRLTDVGAYTNSPGPYGTFDQGGLLYQWTDTLLTTSYSGFAMFNSSFLSSSSAQLKSDYTVYPWSPTDEYNFTGFRIAEVPEPATMTLLMLGTLALIRRRKAAR